MAIERLFGEPGLDEAPSGHLDDEQLAALLEARRPEDAEPEGVAHLSRCDACRREWIELRRDAGLVDAAAGLEQVPWEIERQAEGREAVRAGALRPRRLAAPAWAAAALVLAGVALLLPWDRLGNGTTSPAVRSEGAQAALRPLEPVGEVTGDPVVFRWNEVPGATSYEIVVVEDLTGETVLRIPADASGTTLLPQDRERLLPGRDYRWLVRARRGVGRSSTGTPARFRLR